MLFRRLIFVGEKKGRKFSKVRIKAIDKRKKRGYNK